MLKQMGSSNDANPDSSAEFLPFLAPPDGEAMETTACRCIVWDLGTCLSPYPCSIECANGEIRVWQIESTIPVK